MLKVTLELVSARGPKHNRLLGVAHIINRGQTSFESGGQLGEYSVTLSKWAPKHTETWKKGEVLGFPRRSRGPWDLLYLALRACVGKRNK